MDYVASIDDCVDVEIKIEDVLEKVIPIIE